MENTDIAPDGSEEDEAGDVGVKGEPSSSVRGEPETGTTVTKGSEFLARKSENLRFFSGRGASPATTEDTVDMANDRSTAQGRIRQSECGERLEFATARGADKLETRLVPRAS